MFEKFGEFDSYEDLNQAAAGQLAEGDMEALKELAKENGIDEMDVEDYADGAMPELTTILTAAFGKIEVECAELKPTEILQDWVEYIKMRVQESDDMAKAVRKKGKSIKGCISALLVWSFKNAQPVDKDILKEAGVSAGCKLGIPGIGRAKQIITDYYLG